MGGALGLAVLASVAASRTPGLLEAGSETATALNAGFRAAYLLGAVFVALGAVIATTLLRLPKVGPEAVSGGRPEGATAQERETGAQTDG